MFNGKFFTHFYDPCLSYETACTPIQGKAVIERSKATFSFTCYPTWASPLIQGAGGNTRKNCCWMKLFCCKSKDALLTLPPLSKTHQTTLEEASWNKTIGVFKQKISKTSKFLYQHNKTVSKTEFEVPKSRTRQDSNVEFTPLLRLKAFHTRERWVAV